MNQFIEDRGTILAELGSLMTRFPHLTAAQIVVDALSLGRCDTCDPIMNLREVPDVDFAAAIKAYGDLLHEEKMRAPTPANSP